MGVVRAVLLLTLIAGCAPADESPFWAVDPIVLYPEESGFFGVQTWEVFSERWGRRFAQRWHLCGVVVELEGAETAPCEGCTASWVVSATLAESDCDPAFAADPRFVALDGLHLTEALPDVAMSPPHDAITLGVEARYGSEWYDYGWAYPEALDHREAPASTTWDGSEPFALTPAFAWELSP